MKQYRVYFGNSVPYQDKTFSNYTAVSTFIKKQLDSGITVRSVSKETVVANTDGDYLDRLVKTVDIIGDR